MEILNSGRNKRLGKLMEDRPKLYWLLRSKLSIESMQKIKEHFGDQWVQSEMRHDPLELWRAIKKTHTAYNVGINPLDIQVARDKYNKIRMYPNEGPIELNERLEIALNAIKALNGPLPTDLEQAADFIAKLDENRFAFFKCEVNNKCIEGDMTSFPQTRVQAMVRAQRYNTPRATSSGGLKSTFAHEKISSQKTNSKDGGK